MDNVLRFEIDPQPGESARATTAIVRSAVSTAEATLLAFGLYLGVGVASYFLTPATRLMTFIIALSGVLATMYGLRALSRSRLRRLRSNDPHSAETHVVELSSAGVHAWCAHVDARYPWSDFTKSVQTAEFILLVRPTGTGTAIPKRLVDAAGEAHLRERIREWLPDRGANL
jgi:hypothetical protein